MLEVRSEPSGSGRRDSSAGQAQLLFRTLRAGRAERGQLWLQKPWGALRRPRFTGWPSTPQLAGCEQQSLGRWVQPFLPLGPQEKWAQMPRCGPEGQPGPAWGLAPLGRFSQHWGNRGQARDPES